MADIKFTAFVNDVVASGQAGVWLLKTAESHRRENDAGEWETTARTFRDVRVAKGSTIDLNEFPRDSRIQVEGFEVTVHSERDGQDYYNLCVWADSIELVVSAAPPQQVTKAPAKVPARGSRR